MARSSYFASLLVLFLIACTSMSTPPPEANLPNFSFEGLRAAPVQLLVLDQRAGERDPAWTRRLQDDVGKALTSAGVRLLQGASTRFEVHLLRGRSDFENRQWKGCVEMVGYVIGQRAIDANGTACVEKSNMFGKGTADNVLRLAYEDALVKMLSAIDARLTQ